MKWATRAGVHIDRAACAWLIRRFLEPDAVFVADPADVPADATSFDRRGADLGVPTASTKTNSASSPNSRISRPGTPSST